jgi:hypothetical protein
VLSSTPAAKLPAMWRKAIDTTTAINHGLRSPAADLG